MSVDIKVAVETAFGHVRSLMGNVHGLRLEEVEQSKNRLGWLVTISFLQGDSAEISPVAAFLASKRDYKQVEIDSSGQPIAMRIRKVG